MSDDLELKLKLLANAKGMVKELEDAVDAEDKLETQTKKVGEQNKKTAKTSDTLKKGFGDLSGKSKSLVGDLTSIIGVSGLVSGALAGISVGSSIKEATEVSKLTRQLNISAESLTAWQHAAGKVGIDGDKMSDVFKDINDRVGDFARTGAGPLVDVMEQTNLQIEDLIKLQPDQQFKEIYGALEDIEGISVSEKTFFLEALAGDASKLIPLLDDGAAELERLTQEAREMGKVLSDMDVSRMEVISSQFAKTGDYIDGVGNKISQGLSPLLHGLSSGVNDLAAEWLGLGVTTEGVEELTIQGMGFVIDVIDDGKVALKALEIAWLEVKKAGVDVFVSWGETGAQFADATIGGIVRAFGEAGDYIALTIGKLGMDALGAGMTDTGVKLNKLASSISATSRSMSDYQITTESLKISQQNLNDELVFARDDLDDLINAPSGVEKARGLMQGWKLDLDDLAAANLEARGKINELKGSTGPLAGDLQNLIKGTKDSTKADKDAKKAKDDLKNSQDELAESYEAEIANLERELFALDANVIELAEYDALRKTFGENNLKYNATQLDNIVNLTKEREARKALKDEEEAQADAREDALDLLNDAIQKRDELNAELSGGSVAVLKLSKDYKKLEAGEKARYLQAIKESEITEKQIKQKETYEKLLEDTTRAIELEILAQTQGIDVARERELFYETGSEARAKEILDNEKILEGLDKQKELYHELKDAMSDAYDTIIGNIAATGDLSNALSGVYEGLLDAGKQSSDPYIKAGSYILEFAGALFSDFLTEAEIKLGAGREDFEDESINNLLEIIEKTQYPLLEITKRMSGYLYSMDNKFGIVAKNLGASTGIDVSGSDYIASSTSSLGGIKTRTVELVGAGIEIYSQSLSHALEAGVSAVKFETEKLTKTKLGSTREYLRTSYEDLSLNILDALRDGLAAGTNLILDSGELFGFDFEDQLDAYNIEIGKINFIGLSDEQIQTRLNNVFSEIFSGAIDQLNVGTYVDQLGNIRSKSIGDYIEKYSKVGEDSLETLGRISIEFEQASYAIQLSGKNLETADFDNYATVIIQGTEVVTGGLRTVTEGFIDLSNDFSQDLIDLQESSEDPARFQGNIEALKSAGRTIHETVLDIVDASGGLEQFNENMNAFITNFYTDSEQLAIQQQYLTDSFLALGYSIDEIPETKDEFKDLVQNLPVLTEEGSRLYAETLALSSAFAQAEDAEEALANSSDNATNSVVSLADQISDLAVKADSNISDYDNLFNDNALKFEETMKNIRDLQIDTTNDSEALRNSYVAYVNQQQLLGETQYADALKYAAAVDYIADRYLEAEDAAQRQSDAAEQAEQDTQRAIENVKTLATELFELFDKLNAVNLEIAQGPTSSLADQIRDQIDAQRSVISGLNDEIRDENSRINNLNREQQSIYSEALRAWGKLQSDLVRGRDYLDGLLLDQNLTNLTPAEQLAEAHAQYQAALADQDVSTAQSALQAYLGLARDAYGSTDQYDTILAQSTSAFDALLDQIEAQPEPQEPVDVASALLPTLEAQQATAEAQLELLQQQLAQAQEADRVGSLEAEQRALAEQIRDKMSELDLALNDTLLNDLPDDIRIQLNADLEAIRAASDNAQLQAAMETTRDHVNDLPVDIKSQLDPNLIKLLGIDTALRSGDGTNIPNKLERIATRLWSTSDSLGAAALLGLIRANVKQQNLNWDVSGQNVIPSFRKGADFIDVRAHHGERVLKAASNDKVTEFFERGLHDLTSFKPVVIPSTPRNDKQLEKTNQILVENNKKLVEKLESVEKRLESMEEQISERGERAESQRDKQYKLSKKVLVKAGRVQPTRRLAG